MSHGPVGRGGAAAACACAVPASANMAPTSASASADLAADLLARAPLGASSALLRVCCLSGRWLTPTGKRLIALPLPALALLAGRGRETLQHRVSPRPARGPPTQPATKRGLALTPRSVKPRGAY